MSRETLENFIEQKKDTAYVESTIVETKSPTPISNGGR